MKRTLVSLFAILALALGGPAMAEPNDPGDTPGKSPYHKTHGDQSSHAKPGKGKGKGLGHCKHSPGGCGKSDNGNGNGNGDDDNGDGDGDGNGDNGGALASTGA
jgi:hypothetical protein